MKPPTLALPGRARRSRRPKLNHLPPTPEAAATRDLLAATITTRRSLSTKIRRFITHYVESGQRDPWFSAKAVGYSRPTDGLRIVSRFADVIAAEAARRAIGRKMELTEALERVALLARDAADEKLRHAALRTVLEVEGALSQKSVPLHERGAVERQLEKIVSEIRKKMDGRATTSKKIRARVGVGVEVEVDGEKSESYMVSSTVSADPASAAVLPPSSESSPSPTPHPSPRPSPRPEIDDRDAETITRTIKNQP